MEVSEFKDFNDYLELKFGIKYDHNHQPNNRLRTRISKKGQILDAPYSVTRNEINEKGKSVPYWYCPYYTRWTSIWARCGGERDIYKAATVCEDWKSFMSFRNWLSSYCTEEVLCVDKDLKVRGNSVYCPDKCLAVPYYINNLFLKPRINKGLPTGVLQKAGRRGYSASCNVEGHCTYVGNYDDVASTSRAYLHKKSEVVSNVIERYRKESFYNSEVEFYVFKNLEYLKEEHRTYLLGEVNAL